MPIYDNAFKANPFPFYASLGWRTDPVREKKTGPRRGPGYRDDGWRGAGSYDMPWGSTIEK